VLIFPEKRTNFVCLITYNYLGNNELGREQEEASDMATTFAVVPVERRTDLAISDPIAPFLAGQLSANTKRAYARDIRDFLSFSQARSPKEITRADIEAWRNDMMLREFAPSTIARKLSTIRALLQYCVDEGMLGRNVV
jgi:hypothetical protein